MDLVSNSKKENGKTVFSHNLIKHVPKGTGSVYWGPGDQVTFLATGAETNGAFFLCECLVPPGGGPPPHVHHREHESFYLQEGELTFHAGDQTLSASAGDFVHVRAASCILSGTPAQ